MSVKTLNQIENPITIQDIVVFADRTNNTNPTGEFGKNTNSATQLNRMYNVIYGLISEAAIKHSTTNCDYYRRVLPHKSNHITRLVTNEFAFYTKKPLSLHEFNVLQQCIVNTARMQPENLHLVLSSFAVRTPDDKVMNVVAHVECGPTPRIHFTVKNNPSSIDPVYSEFTPRGRKTLYNIDANRGDKVDHLGVIIDNKKIPFSFNNVFECQTVGGARFHSCVEICLDHAYGVAKNRLNQKLDNALNGSAKRQDFLPTQCSHIVTSNYIYLEKSKLLGVATHADPVCSKVNPKVNASVLTKKFTQNPAFGTPLHIHVTSPVKCSVLPYTERKKVNDFNAKLLRAAPTSGPSYHLPQYVKKVMMMRKATEAMKPLLYNARSRRPHRS